MFTVHACYCNVLLIIIVLNFIKDFLLKLPPDISDMYVLENAFTPFFRNCFQFIL